MEKEFATLVRWYKGDGDSVEVDEPICEIDTDKATVNVPAWRTGVLRQLAKEGDRVSVKSEIARIDPAGG